MLALLNRSVLILVVFLIQLFSINLYAANDSDNINQRLLSENELAPFPEAKDLLIRISEEIDSPKFKESINSSKTLQMMRERLRTSLFHINIVFEVTDPNYPYEPPFREPLPFRPTLEAIDEAAQFIKIVEKVTQYKSPLITQIEEFPYFENLKVLFPKNKNQKRVKAISKKEMAENPVDSYDTLQQRLATFGENASFPEFEEATKGLYRELQSDEIKQLRANDKAFDEICGIVINELEEVMLPPNEMKSRLYDNYELAYPYRRTLQTIEKAVLVFDYRERLKYELGINWHDVEISWFVGDEPKVLQLYHYNRYKYQMAGLLADPEVVLLADWGGASFEYLTRLRAAPLGVLEISTKTARIDRHHNTPSDNYYHDGNHVRRTWGYDKRKLKKRGAKTREEKLVIYREQDAFIKRLLSLNDPKAVSKSLERELRKQERVIIFETIHETALTPDLDSFLYDLRRLPATRQPFEVQMQAQIKNLEDIRRFDGNLKSGADELALNFNSPTIIRYFYDRAPGFLANVDNKGRYGFFDSVFGMQRYMPSPDNRTPWLVAKAAERIFGHLGAKPPSMESLLAQTIDRSGQPELWNYFSIKEAGIVTSSGINSLNVAAADDIHSTWRRNTNYESRWRPTEAKTSDGTIVSDQWSLDLYLSEKAIPEELKIYFKLDKDPATGEMILWEDIRNLPNSLLAKNHQGENLMSGAKSVAIVDRILQKNLEFKTLDQAERWIVAAAQAVHQAVLDRNANGARNNPIYNVHWLLLPPNNQINDLELVRIGFEARMKKATKKVSPRSVLVFQEALSRLYRKIRNKEDIRTCSHSLSVQRKYLAKKAQ